MLINNWRLSLLFWFLLKKKKTNLVEFCVQLLLTRVLFKHLNNLKSTCCCLTCFLVAEQSFSFSLATCDPVLLADLSNRMFYKKLYNKSETLCFENSPVDVVRPPSWNHHTQKFPSWIVETHDCSGRRMAEHKAGARHLTTHFIPHSSSIMPSSSSPFENLSLALLRPFFFFSFYSVLPVAWMNHQSGGIYYWILFLFFFLNALGQVGKKKNSSLSLSLSLYFGRFFFFLPVGWGGWEALALWAVNSRPAGKKKKKRKKGSRKGLGASLNVG